MTEKIDISLVIPCFNEEEVLPETIEKLSNKIRELINNGLISEKSKIYFIDDGSSDNTWKIIQKYHNENSKIFNGIKLSGNRGHQNALLCGLLTVKDNFDAVISIDADLQDDIDVIDKMIDKFKLGYEIVYGVRSNRKKDSFFKRSTAQGYYKLMKFLGVNIIYNHADFRLMGKKALNALEEYGEVNLFLRGIVPLLGFKSCNEYYIRNERTAGKTKYPLIKMIKFAIEGITSFSVKPIRFITFIGIFIFIISICMIVYFLTKYFTGFTVSGWASIVCSLWGIGGLILLSIGIIGEYIGKIFLETKNRPRFHVENILQDLNSHDNDSLL